MLQGLVLDLQRKSSDLSANDKQQLQEDTTVAIDNINKTIEELEDLIGRLKYVKEIVEPIKVAQELTKE